MNSKYKQSMFLFGLLVACAASFSYCGDQPKNETSLASKEISKDTSGKRPPGKSITQGKGTLSFKLDGQLYQTDPKRTKCWSTTTVPLAMLMAYGNGLSISWQMGYTTGQSAYKLDGDKKGTINFTIAGKTYWTRSVMGDNYLDIKITNTKDKYSVILLSGTFEGILEDKDGNKVRITEGKFVTEDI
jgi:hypothetical protein